MSAEGNREAAADRLRRVEALYHEMLARPGEERSAALAAACPNDPALAAEVQAFLDQPDSAAGFPVAPAMDLAARAISRDRTSLLGKRIGVFDVRGLLGVGGMGEVYRAYDTRLGRSVAIKILPRAFKDDPDRLARFEREARTLASLNHPHVCTLYDVGRHEGTDYLVMELVEGETLAERLKKGPLPLDQTLRIATEIAGALDKAHRQGVIHRDLKPGNVMLTKSGSKLMDFGLAKLRPSEKDAHAISALPTAAEPLTGEGTLMGTVPYMAPEQLEGKRPDARSDLWAFGCLMYEMATGLPAFEGKNQASLISAIMAAAPRPISQVEPLTPPALERLVKVCLARDPDDRFQIAHDVMQELKWIAETPTDVVPTAGKTLGAANPPRLGWSLGLGGFALLGSLALVGGLWASWLRRSPPIHAALSVAPAEQVTSGQFSPNRVVAEGGSSTAIGWTPDGLSLVFVGRQGGVRRIFVRDLDKEEARPLEGTEGAQLPTVSLNGKWVAFWTEGPRPRRGSIRRVPIAGGPPTTVIDGVAAPNGMAWGDESIFFGPADCGAEKSVICSVAPDRDATAVTKRSPGVDFQRHTLPHLLPNGRALLYTVRQRTDTWGDERVVAHVFDTGEDRVLLEDAVDARYVESGHLVFLRRGTLFGVGFDLSRIEVEGTPIPIQDAVSQALSGSGENATGAGQFSVSSTGALAWLWGPVAPYPPRNIVAVDRQGRIHPLNVPTNTHFGPLALRPDGHQIAAVRLGLQAKGLWIYDLDRGTSMKVVEEGQSMWPRWAPDGQHLAFSRLDKGLLRILWRKADGTGPLETLVTGHAFPSSWTPDGRQLAFLSSGDIADSTDIWIATLGPGAATLRPLNETPDQEWGPEFSPDGRWLAYSSNASGQHEVYVQPYPGPGPRRQVSVAGGFCPAWNASGREIFFLSQWHDETQTRDLMAVDVGTGVTPSLGKPRRLFEFAKTTEPFGWPLRNFAVGPAGQYFYVTQYSAPESPSPRPVTQIRLVTNWVDELKAKVAAGQAK